MFSSGKLRSFKGPNSGRKNVRSAASEQTEVQQTPLTDFQPQKLSQKRELEDHEQTSMDAHSALMLLLKAKKPKMKQVKTKRRENLNLQQQDLESSGEREEIEPQDQVEGNSIHQEEDSEEEHIPDSDDSDDDSNDKDVATSVVPDFSHFSNPDIKLLKAPESWKTIKCPDLSVLGDRTSFIIPEGQSSNDSLKIPLSALKTIRPLIKHRLLEPLQARSTLDLTPLQSEFAASLFNYNDIFISNWSWHKSKQFQALYVAHALNHVYKTRDKVLKHNSKLASSKDSDLEYRDQGFTRPKVLILLPTRNSAYEVVNNLMSSCGLEQPENKKRFKQAFYAEGGPGTSKPNDFQAYFKGNTDDMFCLGLKFTRKVIKLYSSFYSSDIIVASPLGLRMIIGSEGDKKRDYDFLSSIEIVIVDQAHGMQAQNWDNVEHVFKHMNLIPTESHGCDFSRVRPWYLDNQAKFLRQTIILSEYATPDMNSLFSRYCLNVYGKLRVRQSYEGSMSEVGMKVRQTFNRFGPGSDPSQDPDLRFKYFTSVLIPSILRANTQEGTLIFIPSYYDFTRLRNYMDDQNLSCASISEYSSISEVSRARTMFASGRSKILLYTERLHFFRRYQIKGAHNVLMYGLPEDSLFYAEIMRFLTRTVVEMELDPVMVRARVLFSKWDALKLERIVGTKRVGLMLRDQSDSFDFQ